MAHCRGVPGRARLFIFALACVAALAHALEIVPPQTVPGVSTGEPVKKPAKTLADKANGPDHNVGLNEDPAATDLFNRAKKARARAEANPEAWPECVKDYLEILKKHRNSVYLDKWEGPNNTEPAYKNGLYRSARERAMNELATLPPAALAVYRAIAEPVVRQSYQEAREQFDPHKMEELARDYPLTSWGQSALVWLAEYAFDRGAWKDAAARFLALAETPDGDLKPPVALARALLAQIHAGDKESAITTLAALQEALKKPENGPLKVGGVEGDAALAQLKTRVEGLAGASANPQAAPEGSNSWTTYFGNTTHLQLGQARTKIGLRKWSIRLDELLYGAGNGERSAPGNPSLINQHLTVQDGILHLTDERAFAAYPVNDPHPGTMKEGGDGLYRLPSESVRPPDPPPAADPNNPFMNMSRDAMANVEHPCFTTLAGGRWFGIVKNAELPPQYPGMWGGRMRIMMAQGGVDETAPKEPLNYVICMGRAQAGEEPSVLWSLKPGEPAFNAQSAKDQEWLRSVGFCSAPVYDAGVLYATATTFEGSNECSAVALDAESGRILWTTMLASGNPLSFQGAVMPDRGVPVTVVNGSVYALTNLGAVAVLNAATGEVRWIRVYDRLKAQPNPFNGGEFLQIADLWAPNPPLVVENRLLIAPEDADTLYAYDIQTGARIWEHSRRVDSQDSGERGLRYILGVVNGVVAVSGNDIRLLKVKNGKRIAESYTPETRIVGRGTVTPSGVLVSTEKGLLQIDIAQSPGGGDNYTVSAPRLQEWADGAVEAGHVFSIGGLLYTISHTHLNAYFIWEEMEAQLRARLAQNAADKTAHVELADIYASLERYDDALTEWDAARKNLSEGETAALSGVARRRVEALLAGGVKRSKQKDPDFDGAIKAFQDALATVKSGGLPEILSVTVTFSSSLSF